MPELLLVLTITLEFGGGILLMLGWKARWACGGVVGFYIDHDVRVSSVLGTTRSWSRATSMIS